MGISGFLVEKLSSFKPLHEGLFLILFYLVFVEVGIIVSEFLFLGKSCSSLVFYLLFDSFILKLFS